MEIVSDLKPFLSGKAFCGNGSAPKLILVCIE